MSHRNSYRDGRNSSLQFLAPTISKNHISECGANFLTERDVRIFLGLKFGANFRQKSPKFAELWHTYSILIEFSKLTKFPIETLIEMDETPHCIFGVNIFHISTYQQTLSLSQMMDKVQKVWKTPSPHPHTPPSPEFYRTYANPFHFTCGVLFASIFIHVVIHATFLVTLSLCSNKYA